jgi:hypothetical protein
MKYPFVLLAVGCLLSTAAAQMSWWRTYGGPSDDWGYSVQRTTDGGYIIGGFRAASVYLIKTNAHGDSLWARTYGGPDQDWGTSVQQTTDGGYVIVGSTYSFGVGSPDNCNVYLIRTNASGDTLWTRTYGGADHDIGSSVQQIIDGGYVITGSTRSFGAGNYDIYLIRTNASGDTLWTRTYGGSQDEYVSSARQTADGGYIITGCTVSFGVVQADIYLIKTDASGESLWTRTLGGPGRDYGESAQQTTDGGYMVAGYTSSFGAGGYDFYLVKTNASGETLWTRTYGGSNDDAGKSAQQTADGGYVIAGVTYSFGAGYADVYLIKTDAQGDTLWTRTHGGPGADEAWQVQQTADGGYVIAGFTSSSGAGGDDVYLIKTDAEGHVGVAEERRWAPTPSFKQAATVLSGASGVRRLASCVVFDPMGRRVLNPRSGILFVRDEGREAGDAGRTRKVVLQR